MQKIQVLDAFYLKIIAMLTMVIDHIGAYFLSKNTILYLCCRYIGRLSFPLFAFLLVEGIFHSKNPIKYLLRLFLLDLIIDIGSLIFMKEYISSSVLMNFVIGGLTILIIEKGKKWQKVFSLIPFTIGILSGFSFFPFKMQYGPYGLTIILIFYISKKIAEYLSHYICSFGLNYQEYIKSSSFRIFYIAITISLNIVLSLILVYFSDTFKHIFTSSDVNYVIQSFAIISLFLLLFYNGQRGYNKKWFQYGCYIFFPLHFILLYLIKLIIRF